MVTLASSYFSLITGGLYERLVTDDTEEQPILCALRAGGSRIKVEEMSEGTADQLYLALRLAALELRRTSHPQMPLVLDDALITSDDERAAQHPSGAGTVRQGGQVMIFTHHRHLLEVARAALAGPSRHRASIVNPSDLSPALHEGFHIQRTSGTGSDRPPYGNSRPSTGSRLKATLMRGTTPR